MSAVQATSAVGISEISSYSNSGQKTEMLDDLLAGVANLHVKQVERHQQMKTLNKSTIAGMVEYQKLNTEDFLSINNISKFVGSLTKSADTLLKQQ